MLRLGLYGVGAFRPPRYHQRQKAAIENARLWLDRVGLIERADDPAGDLPYGAQRRLEIARAMCTDPVLLCLDEPAAGLNPREAAELNELCAYPRPKGTSILLIEHDMGVVMEISDHIVVLDYGGRSPTARRSRSATTEGDRRLSRRRGRGGRNRRSGGRPVTTTSRRPRRQNLLRPHHGAEGRRPGRQRGRDRDPDRRQRRRQVHLDDDDLRQPARARRLASSSTAGHHTDCRPTRSCACGIAQSPEGRRISRA